MSEKTLNIDIISDLHLDMYTRMNPREGIQLFVRRFFKKDGDVLILAGDLTHDTAQLPELFKLLAEKYNKILVVPGNHDFYLIPEYMQEHEKFSEDRYQSLLEACNNSGGKVVMLNCDYYEYEGVTFFGMPGWYDGQYAIEHFNYDSRRVNNLYSAVMNDSRRIKFRDDDNSDMFNRSAREQIKINNLGELRKADVFISHAIPSIDKALVHEKYREEVSTCFYTFDGEAYLEAMEPKLVVHGHTHMPMSTEYKGRKYIVNPLGYPWEGNDVHGPKRMSLDIDRLSLDHARVPVTEGEQ